MYEKDQHTNHLEDNQDSFSFSMTHIQRGIYN